MLEGTKKIFPNDWNRFLASMIDAAEQDNLPVALQMDDISGLDLKDIQDVFNDFQNATGLDMTGHLFICPDCGRLHLLVEVDYKDEEETLIQ